MSLFLLNRSPEPSETNVPVDEEVFLEVIENTGEDVDLSSTMVWLASEGGPEVLAFDGSSGTPFQPGFDGPNSTTANPLLGIRQIRIDVSALWNSLETVTVHVVSASTATIPVLLDTTYTFTVEDLTPPLVLSASARGLQQVRVFFDEPLGTSALEAANYTLTRLEGPAVEAEVVSVVLVSPSTFDVTTDIPLSPGRRYRVTVLDVEDLFGNLVAAPFNAATFEAFIPAEPADREFDLYRLLPVMNRQEDVREDLLKFVACLQETTDLLLYEVDRWADIIDPDLADLQYVDAMLADLGNPFPFAESLSLIDKRRLALLLVPIYRSKGTEVGIVNAIRFFLGLEVTIDEYIDTTSMTLGESELGETGSDGEWILGPSTSFLRFAFVVVAEVVLTQEQRDRIEDIVEYMKPAHTHYLGTVEPTAPVVIDHLELGLSELGVTWELH